MLSDNIAITVHPQYLVGRSDPTQNYYVFSYTIRIQNNNSMRVQLLERYWKITDADNQIREVSGRGVVGEEPHIASTEHFQYTSVAILATPVGSMEGFYTLRTDDGELFTAKIPAFSLANPKLLH